MLKNITKILKVIVTCTVIMVSPYACAGTMTIPIELECSRGLMLAQWVTFNGEPGTQYTLTTKGIRDAERKKEGIITVRNVNSLGRTHYGLYVYVEARCMPRNGEVNMSLTGSSLTCDEGEGIKIKMSEPNSMNKNGYNYVGTLTIVQDEKEESKVATVIDSKRKPLQYKTQLIVPETEPHNCHFGFDSFANFY